MGKFAKYRLRINPVFLLLLSGGALLWVAFPIIKQEIFSQSRYRQLLTGPENLLHIPISVNNDSVFCYNRSNELLFSLNGGDHFQVARDGVINFDEVANNKNIFQPTSIRWRHPKGEFPQALSLVLKVRNPKKKVETKPYTVQYVTNESALPAVAVSISEADMFNWVKGLMIYGDASNYDDGFQKDWWYRSANFANRGSEWKRGVQLTYFDTLGNNSSYFAEMAISGNATRYFPQKSLKFYLTDEEGRKQSQKVKFWPNGIRKARSFLLRNSGNDNMKTMFADLLIHELANDANILVQEGQPVRAFINGNYWGIYNLRERLDARFVAEKENVKRDEVTILFCEVYGDQTRLKTGDDRVKKEFDAFIAKIKKENTISYNELKEVLSIKSFIDYILVESFFANNDWLHNNVTFYKADKKDWKWILNDMDYSMAYPGAHNINKNQFQEIKISNSIIGVLYNALMKHRKFKDKLKKRGQELLKTCLSAENIQSTYSRLFALYDPEIKLQINRWRFIQSKQEWVKDCEANVNFLLDRRTIFLEQLNNL